MLERLNLSGVGPAAKLELELGPRLNVVTGDNGLGKTFLLDIAWWALTRTWSGPMAYPNSADSKPTIEFAFEGAARRREYVSTYDRRREE